MGNTENLGTVFNYKSGDAIMNYKFTMLYMITILIFAIINIIVFVISEYYPDKKMI